MKKPVFLYVLTILLAFAVCEGDAQIVLLGDNAPYPNVNDGDFMAEWGYWRQEKQSPFWKTYAIDESKEGKMGLHYGQLFSNRNIGVAESKVLNTNPGYQNPEAGDLFLWNFGADLEYISNGTLSFSLVFGEHERLLAERVKLKGSDKEVEHFSGKYRISEEDAKAGLPFVRVTFYSSDGIKVFLDYVNISVASYGKRGPRLKASMAENGVRLSWRDSLAREQSHFVVYRMRPQKRGGSYIKIGETTSFSFLDKKLIHGVEYIYVVTRIDDEESAGSNKVKVAFMDEVAPESPQNLRAEIFDTEIKLHWQKSRNVDVSHYSVFRRAGEEQEWVQVADNIKGQTIIDFTPVKETENAYVVYSHDFSGNRSEASDPVMARVNMVQGASFSDLILPMPVGETGLCSGLWGTDAVLPRNPDNGIESPEWSYWGGRPVKGTDGRWHMNVTRWPANATKGHWEWPNSTVAYTVAEDPTGPYNVLRHKAYKYAGGYGHNPDVILLNDGSYLLYSLIDFEPHLFQSQTMKGPWQHLGILTVDTTNCQEIPERHYRFERNLSGVQLDDGRILFVTKAGAMMVSQGKNPLGPYKVLTPPVQNNPTIPERYRNSNYEDPVLWKDDVQYHMIINAFLDYRAIYLRSGDGINWVFNSGTAYTPNCTGYTNGIKTHWYKLERPHVITDEYGRATHLSLAAIDVPKKDDLAWDNHNSKNIILPLLKSRRLLLLDYERVGRYTCQIRVKIIAEPGFNSLKDVDVNSLRFGAASEVDFGRGCLPVDSYCEGEDLIVVFDGKGNGLTENDFSCKLLGRTISGKLLFGYTRNK